MFARDNKACVHSAVHGNTIRRVSITYAGPLQNRDPHIHMNARVGHDITSEQKHPCPGPLSSAKRSKNLSPSTAVRNGTKCPTSSPPPPPDTADNCTKEGPDYDEPDMTVVGSSSVQYYASKDLVADRKDLQSAQTTGEYNHFIFVLAVTQC